MGKNFHVEQKYFTFENPGKLQLRACYCDTPWENQKLEFFLDEEKIPAELQVKTGRDAIRRYGSRYRGVEADVIALLSLPENLKCYKKFRGFLTEDGEKVECVSCKVSELERLRHEIDYCLDSQELQQNQLVISGWFVGSPQRRLEVLVNGKEAKDVEVIRRDRLDVKKLYDTEPSLRDAGFRIKIPYEKKQKVTLIFLDGERKSREKIVLDQGKGSFATLQRKARKVLSVLRHRGIGATIQLFRRHFRMKRGAEEYEAWRLRRIPGEKELQQQREKHFSYEPKISVVVPLYKTPEKFLREMIASVCNQTYGNWELCLSDGGGVSAEYPQGTLHDILKSYQKEERIKVVVSQEPLQISSNTNAAISIATGEFIAFMDHDDLLTPDALFEMVKAINKHPQVEVLYSDEVKIDMNGLHYFSPHFKPDFSLFYLRNVNYISHLNVVRTDLCRRLGGLREEFDGAQDHDFILRCVDETRQIVHVPQVLYHWRSHQDSTAENPESKLYAFEAGKRAIGEHLKRNHISATVEDREHFGFYKVTYDLEEEPLVSVIIPNKDAAEDLRTCIESIEQKSTYQNLEYIIVENNSVTKEIFDYYKELEETNPRVKVCYYEGGFNYSKINNFGVPYAKGEYLLFLNNDTELLAPDSIRDMLSICMQDRVGVVGAKLLYPDDSVQHAGVIVGLGGVAGHCFLGIDREEAGYFARALCTQNYSAVTAACMMSRRSVFEEVGGFTEELAVAFNDIDYCLKTLEAGKMVVFSPEALLRHYESKSRGSDQTPEKMARFQGEMERFNNRWMEFQQKGDPFYNPNLTLSREAFELLE